MTPITSTSVSSSWDHYSAETARYLGKAKGLLLAGPVGFELTVSLSEEGFVPKE